MTAYLHYPHIVLTGNEETLKLIDSAVFALCLEDDQPTDPNDVSRKFLHGEAGRM